MANRYLAWMRDATEEDLARLRNAVQLQMSVDRLRGEGRREEALEAVRELAELFTAHVEAVLRAERQTRV